MAKQEKQEKKANNRKKKEERIDVTGRSGAGYDWF